MTLPTTPTPDAFVTEGAIRCRVAFFVNKAACRQFIMDCANQTRHHKFGRVDPAIYDELNAVLRKHMKAIVARNPSVGKTIR
jgi:hypothetical protein